MKATDRNKKCLSCGEVFFCRYFVGIKKWNRTKFCSQRCYKQYRKTTDIKKGKYLPCLVCGKKKYYAEINIDGRKTYCSWKCKQKGQIKKKKLKICEWCGRQFFPKGHSSNIRFCNHTCSGKGRNWKPKIGIDNWKWKGENVGYYALHTWIYRKKGKPKICLFCGKSKNMMHWANIDGKYRRRLKDFISLCASCHKKYDMKNKIIDV